MRHFPAIVVVVVLHASIVTAQTTPTTRLIPYSGTVTDAAGLPQRGPVRLVFELYEDQEAGTPLWQETQSVQPDDRGRYLVYLGAVTTIPRIAFSEERARWLAVTTDGRESPRVMLVAVPYALRAADAETLGGQPLSSFVLSGPDGRLRTNGAVVAEPVIDGSGTPGQLPKYATAMTVGDSIITETAAGRIGIGTTDPSEGGVLDSKVTIRTSDGTTGLAISNQTGVPRFALNVNGDGSWIAYDRALGTYTPGVAQRGGRVAIATADATGGGVVDSRFTVRNLDNNTGIAVLNQAHARRFALNTHAAGGWTLYDGGSGMWNQGLSQVDGNVGIGTMTPGNKLRIVGGSNTVLSTAMAGHALRADAPDGTTVLLAYINPDPGVGDIVATGGAAILGYTDTAATGVLGRSGSGDGAHGFSVSGNGVFGTSLTGLAGMFQGDVTVSGTLSKGGGSFRIDHPLDPTNKYLSHSFVESPDMMNVYNGNARLDASGEAWVTLPEWFEALNRDFRYQLTALGSPGPNLYIAAKVSGNRFRISGGAPGGEVSWQITGVRQDAWANAHRIAVEQHKPAGERGSYLHPKEHGQPSTSPPAPVTVSTRPDAGRQPR